MNNSKGLPINAEGMQYLDLYKLLHGAYLYYDKDKIFVNKMLVNARDEKVEIEYMMTFSREKAEDLIIFVHRSFGIEACKQVLNENTKHLARRFYHLNVEQELTPVQKEHPIRHIVPSEFIDDQYSVIGSIYGNTHEPFISTLVDIARVPLYVKSICIAHNAILITPTDECKELWNPQPKDWNKIISPSQWLEVWKIFPSFKDEEEENNTQDQEELEK